MTEDEQARLDSIRRGGRKAERRAHRYETHLKSALSTIDDMVGKLDDLADKIEAALAHDTKETT